LFTEFFEGEKEKQNNGGSGKTLENKDKPSVSNNNNKPPSGSNNKDKPPPPAGGTHEKGGPTAM